MHLTVFNALLYCITDCARAVAQNSGKACNKIDSDVDIFYDGKDKASREEKQDMFDLLIATIEAQAASGDFKEAGTLEKVGSSSSSSGSGPPVGLVAGVVAAAAVVAGGLLYKKRRQGAGGEKKRGGDTDESSDEDVPVARVVAMEEEDKKYKKDKK